MKSKPRINLAELKAKNLPHIRWQDVLNVTSGEMDPEDAAAMDAYFSRFVLTTDGKCVNCGLVQGGLMSVLLGGFTYGIAHGEGWCSRCNYPARANHYDVGPIKYMEMILQYHPDILNHPKEQTDNDIHSV